MKTKLEKYELVHEDQKFYKVRHPDGSEMTIAKSLLTPDQHAKIKANMKKPDSVAKMSEGGEVHNQPCKNSSCKSFGQPHPNCRCYGNMAKGGKVDSFCSKGKSHDKTCEYFKGEAPKMSDGGERTASGVISPTESTSVPMEAQASAMPVAKDDLSDIIPAEAPQMESMPTPTAVDVPSRSVASTPGIDSKDQVNDPNKYFTNGTFDHDKFILDQENGAPIQSQTAVLKQMNDQKMMQQQSAVAGIQQHIKDTDAYNSEAAKAGLKLRPYSTDAQKFLSSSSASAVPTIPSANQISAPQASGAQAKPGFDPMGQFSKGMSLQMQGINEQAQAAAAKGADIADTLDTQASAQRKAFYQYEQEYRNLKAENDNLFKEVHEGKVDPNKYWDSKSTAGKIGAAIAIALGGLGGGLNRTGQNMALDTINKQIERDIDAQKANITNKRSLLSFNLEKTRNMQDAIKVTMAQLQTIAAAQIQRAGAAKMGPEAEAIKHQMSGALLQSSAATLRDFALLNTANKLSQQGGVGTNDPSDTRGWEAVISSLDIAKPELAKVYKEQLVPGVGMAKRPVPDKVREELINKTVALKHAKELREFAKLHSGTLPTTLKNAGIINEGKALAFAVLNDYRTSTGQGTYKPSQAEADTKLVDEDPTRFFAQYLADPRYGVLERLIGDDLKVLKEQYGLPTPYTPAKMTPYQGRK